MIRISYIFQIVLLLVSGRLNGQDAPITTVSNAFACPGNAITIPVRVTSFSNIGSLSLKLQYDTSSFTFQTWNNTAGFPGLALNSSVPGMLVIGGYTDAPGGISLADNSIFFTITFLYHGGAGTLTWFDNGGSCEYTGPTPNFIPLNDIPTNQYYISGAVNPSLVADFTANTQLPGVNEPVIFTDLSAWYPTGWIWSFSPATYLFVNGTSATSKNPVVQFTNHGSYAVSLTVSTRNCSVFTYRTDWIHVGIPGLWTGELSSDWNTAANWHNWTIPNATSEVVIPPSALNWPEFPGNFTIGIQCIKLTIQGATSQMTVTGDFIIP